MSNTVILLKYSSANGKPASLNTAEPAYSAVSNTLWIHDGTSIVEIGGLDYTRKINQASSDSTANVLVKRDETGNVRFNYVIANNIVGSIPTTGVIAGTYGSQTKIPTFTVQTDGRISFAGEQNVATLLNVSSDTQAGNLSLLTDTLRILGADGVSVAFSDANNTFIVDVDDTVIRTIKNSQTITGNIILNGSIDSSANVDAQNIIAFNKFYAGLATQSATPLPNLIAQFTSNSALYTQVNQQNIDGDGSADFVITADVGTDTTFYTDVGMSGSTYNFYNGYDTPFEPLTGYFLVQGNTGQVGGNMLIGTTSPSTNIRFLVGGFETSNVVAKLEETGLVITKGDITSNITTRTLNIANSAFDQANLAFNASNTANSFSQANVGAAVIFITAAYEANVGAGRISDKASWEANSGAGIIAANNSLKNYTDSTFVKLTSPSVQIISGDLSLSGNFSVTGTTTYINTTELNVADNEVVLNSDLVDIVPTQNAGIIVNRSLYTNTYIRWNESDDYWVISNNVAEGRIATIEGYEANVGAARIADTAAAQANTGALRIDFNTANSSLAANIGAARIADTAAAQANTGAALIEAKSYTDTANNYSQANVGTLRIDFNTANSSLAANIGAARIADAAAAQANVGAGLISITNDYQANVGAGLISITNDYQANVGSGLIAVTNAYQANVGALRIDANTANSSLAANIGAARIADAAASQANVGAGLIAVTNAYEANVGASRIADSASAQANTGAALIEAKSYTDTANNYLQANVGSSVILITSAYQANIGAGLIANKQDSDANTGALRIDFNTANSSLAANIGAGRIADSAAAQANTGAALIEAKSYTDTANNYLQANTGSALITAKSYTDTANSYLQANIGAARIADSASAQANTGSALIEAKSYTDTANSYLQANVGASRIADSASAQANTGAALIEAKLYTDTANNYSQANTGAARIADTAASQANTGAALIEAKSYTDTANNYLQANVGAARIADVSSAQANTGAALIEAKSYTDTANSYLQANIGAARIADTASAQANTGSARIEVLGRADSAFAQANLAYNKANVGGDFSGFANVTSNVSVGTYLDLNTNQSVPSYKEGRIFYNNVDKSVSYFNETNDEIELGQKYTIRVWNNTASTISDGAAVYIDGASANGLPSVALANAAIPATSEVIGLATMSIAAGAYGYVAGAGKIDGLNTSMLSPGQELYLSATTPGGYTTVAPAPPAVPVTVGYAVVSDLTNGSILVNIHLMEGRNKTNGAILFARNDAIDEDPTHLYWDFVNNRLGINTDTPQANLHVAGETLLSGNVIITGNLSISNAQSITTSELTVGGNVIILNSEFVGTPSVNAEIVVNRGNQANVYIRWNEQINEWVMFEDAGYSEGHIIHSEKTAKTWADYTAMPAYEKLTHPIGADLANTTNETAKAAFTQANTAITSSQANVGAAVISITSAYQANVGAGLITVANTVTNNYQANVGALRIDANAANSSLAANIGAARIADASAAQANVGAGLITVANTVTNNYQANVGAGLITVANTVTNNYQANVGAGLLVVKNAYEANTGVLNIIKVNRAGDYMTGSLTSGSTVTGSSLVANVSVSVNTNTILESTTVTTSTNSQFILDSLSTSTYRSGKYFVQMTSGSQYHIIELSFVHDNANVYLSQYGEIKTGSSLGTFDASISGGVLSLLSTPTNAITVYKLSGTLITT
jgi:ribosomal protein L7/L12